MDWLGILIGTAIAAFVLVTLLPLIRAYLVRDRAVPGLGTVLDDDQRRAPRLLVYFWGPQCGMCRGMTPVIDRLADETRKVIKVNVTEYPGLAREFGVMATPSLAVVEQGILRRLVVGGRSEPQIRTLLPD